MTEQTRYAAGAAHSAPETRTTDPIELLRRSAWVPIVRGVASVLFGAAAFVVPNTALAVLVALFGAYAFLTGILAIYAAVTLATRHQAWLGMLFEGVLGIAAGIIAYRTPELTAVALLYLLGAWAILRGVLEIATAYALRQLVPGEWATAVSGVLSIALGCLLFAYPQSGLLAWVWVIGFYAILYGVLMIVLGSHLRKLGTAEE